MTILFWGTGSYAFNWIKNNNLLIQNFNCIKFISKNTNEKEFLGKEVITPNKIVSLIYDKLCILSSFEKNIRIEAIEEYHIPAEKIITIQELEEYIININEFKNNFDIKTLIKHLAKNEESEITSLINDYYDYKYIKEIYQDYINKYIPIKVPDHKSNRIIWICWFQGYENAPKIVQACINSIKKYMLNYKNNIYYRKKFSKICKISKTYTR